MGRKRGTAVVLMKGCMYLAGGGMCDEGQLLLGGHAHLADDRLQLVQRVAALSTPTRPVGEKGVSPRPGQAGVSR